MADLLSFITGSASEPNPVSSLVSRLTRPISPWTALRWNATAAPWGIPFVAYAAGKSQPGERLATIAGGASGLTVQPFLTAGTMSALRLVAPALPVAAAAFAAVVLSIYPSISLGQFVTRKVRTFTKMQERVRRIEMGGDFRDSETSKELRFQAIQDMSSSRVARRQFLGQEAVIFHQ